MDKRGAGGTPGGVGEFFLGLGLTVLGLYLILSRVVVHTSFWSFGGIAHPFGVSLLPILFGMAMVFANGKSVLGWALAVGGLLFVLAGVLLNMQIFFQQTSLVTVLIMIGVLAAGLGLIARSLRPH